MKKFLLISYLLTALVLAGCAKNVTTTPITNSVSTMTTDQLFQKKQECAGKYNDYVKYLNSLDVNSWSSFTVLEIFYSPSLNTCIAGTQYSNDSLYFIDDVLTTKEFTNSYGTYGWEKWEYDSKIKELKWE